MPARTDARRGGTPTIRRPGLLSARILLPAALALAAGAPGTVSISRDGFPVVACGVGGLKLLKLQRAGKSAQAADAFLRGFTLAAGTVLAPPAVVPLPT